jgi:CubicO group peptidase (beta-lactamase class C family)
MAKGFAIRSERIPNQTGTRFQMASGCKVFTSLAICQLVAQGKLEFNTRLRDCVDVTFPKYAPEINIHQLLTHTSGITSYFEEDINPDYEALWDELPLYKVRRPGDFLPLFQNKPMKFAPGERFDYNDGGYILLGLVVEALSGVDFSTYIQKHVFDPAGMEDSGYFAADQLPERTAYAYIQNPDGGWRTNFFAVPVVGAPDGGAYTSAPDMDGFWKALMGDKLLALEMREMMLTPHTLTGWEWPTHYGYGVWIEKRDVQTRKYFVEGADPGVALRSVVYPAEGLTLTVLGNTGDALWYLYPEIEKILGL